MSKESQYNTIRSMILNLNNGDRAKADQNLKDLIQTKINERFQQEYNILANKMKEKQ